MKIATYGPTIVVTGNAVMVWRRIIAAAQRARRRRARRMDRMIAETFGVAPR